jgi:hypothetical protein
MSFVKNMSDLGFGRLTVMKRAGSDRGGTATWLCHGKKVIVVGESAHAEDKVVRVLRPTSHARPPQILSRNAGIPSVARNARAMPSTASRWLPVVRRQEYPVCKRWRADFEAFLADVGLKPAPHMVLSRIDKGGDHGIVRPFHANLGASSSARSRAVRTVLGIGPAVPQKKPLVLAGES